MSVVGELRIGPLSIVCTASDDYPPLRPVGAYASFFRPAPVDTTPASCTLHLRLTPGDTSPPDRNPDFASGKHWKLYRDDRNLLFATGYGDRRPPERMLTVRDDMTDAEIRIDPLALKSIPLPDRLAFPLSYPLDQILAWGMLAQMRAVLLHAALVIRPDGAGCLLAGPSGAGKSTLSAYCADAGWTVLNDDRALIYADGERWLVSGTPWHGSGKYAEPRTVPLSGIYFLAQSETNRVEEISSTEVLTELLRVTSLPVFLDGWCTPTLATLDTLTRAIPMRRLHFRRDPSAVDALSG